MVLERQSSGTNAKNGGFGISGSERCGVELDLIGPGVVCSGRLRIRYPGWRHVTSHMLSILQVDCALICFLFPCPMLDNLWVLFCEGAELRGHQIHFASVSHYGTLVFEAVVLMLPKPPRLVSIPSSPIHAPPTCIATPLDG